MFAAYLRYKEQGKLLRWPPSSCGQVDATLWSSKGMDEPSILDGFGF